MKFKGFLPGEVLPAENVNSVDPENIESIAPAYLQGGANPSSLSVFNSVVNGDKDSKIKAIIDGVSYDNIKIFSKYDILNFSYASKSFALGGTSSNIFLSPDGTKIFYGFYNFNQGRYLCERTLSTPWDISTAGGESRHDINAKYIDTFQGIYFSPDGKKLILSGSYNSTPHPYVNTFNLSTAWDVSTATYLSYKYDGAYTYGYDVWMSDNGTKMYWNINGTIKQFTLSTAWDVSTAVDDNKNRNSFPYWFDNGTKAFIVNGGYLKIYNAGTAWDDSTLIDSGDSIAITNGGGAPFMNLSKTRIFMGGGTCYQYNNGIVLNSYNDIANIVQTAIRTATGGQEIVSYNTDHFVITSEKIGWIGSILKLESPSDSEAEDISGNGSTLCLDCGVNATEVAGTGDNELLLRLDSNGRAPLGTLPFMRMLGATQTRAGGTVYQNTTSKNMLVMATLNVYGNSGNTSYYGQAHMFIGASSSSLVEIANIRAGYAVNVNVPVVFIVPPGYYYEFTTASNSGGVGVSSWYETYL